MTDNDQEIKLPSKGEIIGLYEKVSQNRFKSFSGYKLDRWLFQAIMWGLFAFFFMFAYANNFELDYYKCESGFQHYEGIDEGCQNPFYKPTTWKNLEVLPVGEYGKPPSALFKAIWIITIGSFILGAIINHAIHNRGYKKNGVK